MGTTAHRFADYRGNSRTHAKTRWLRLQWGTRVEVVSTTDKTAQVRPLTNIAGEATSEFSYTFRVRLSDLRFSAKCGCCGHPSETVECVKCGAYTPR